MIYGNNVRLEKENDNREVRCRLLMKKTTAAAEYEVSSGLNYWQFANAAVAVMRKKDRVFDLFYFPCRNLTGPLVCGPRDVFEFKLFGADFVYHLTDGWFWLNHRPGKQKLENGREMFLGDVYLGKKSLPATFSASVRKAAAGTFPPLMRKRTLLKRANTFLSRRLRTEKQALRSIRTAAVTCFATATASRPIRRADIGNCR